MFVLPLQSVQQAQSLPQLPDLSSPRMAAPMLMSSTPQPQQSQQVAPNRSGRPKLSLNTKQTRSFGKGSSLRLETLSAVSPTVINTFSNAYETERARRLASESFAASKLSIDMSMLNEQSNPTDGLDCQDLKTPSSSSDDSGSTLNSATIPYSISQVLNSVLANSPLQPRIITRKMLSRPCFPAEKRVSFRTPLVEQITTTKYTIANSDLDMSDYPDPGSSTYEDAEVEEPTSSFGKHLDIDSINRPILSPGASDDMRSLTISTDSTPSMPSPSETPGWPRQSKRSGRSNSRTKSPRAGEKRDSSSESDSDTCPATPVAGRRKRQREWTWTLGPLPGATTTCSAPQPQGA